MKKILLFASALAGLFLAGSCQRENLEPAAQGGVTYEISLPTGPQTKGEEGYATYDLHYEVYKTADANALATAPLLFEKTVTMTGNTTTVTLDLLNDQDYTVLFWANKAGANENNKYFDLNDLRNVVVKTATANNDDRDAFCGMDQLVQHDGAQSKTVELKRPFAQINIATLVPKKEDIGYDVTPTHSYVKVSSIPMTFNVFTGLPVGNTTAVEFSTADAPAKIPSDDITVNGTAYNWVAMNYILVPESVVEVYYEITTANGVVKNTISNVPVKKNYRTNIIGNLLTSNATYNVILLPGFEEGAYVGPEFVKEPAYNAETKTWTVTNADELAWVAASVNGTIGLQTKAGAATKTFKGEKVVLANDIDLQGVEWEPIGATTTAYFQGTFDGDNHAISNFKVTEKAGHAGLFGYARATIKNLKVNNVTLKANHYAGAIVGQGYCHIDNCDAENINIIVTIDPAADAGKGDYGDKAGAIIGQNCEGSLSVTNCTAKNVIIEGYRDLGGIMGMAHDRNIVTGNSVENVTIIQNLNGAYKTDVPTTLGAIAGRWGNNVTEENNSGDANIKTAIASGVYASKTETDSEGNTTVTEYSVYAAEGLEWVASQVDEGCTFEDVTIQLSNDLDLSNDNWNPIGDNRTDDPAFSGTFDGNGHTIKGAHITGDHCFNGAVYGSKEGWGLFSVTDGATIKNLKVDGATFASYTVISGTIAGYAKNTTFENIEISNTKISGYNWYTGGVVGWAEGECTFKGVNLDETVAVGTLWDSHGQNAGGIAGGVSASAKITIEDCNIACVLDVINDVTSNYKWYIYRVAGMIIGNTNTTETKYNEVVTATATNVTCKNVTVTYGDWMNYHYCQGYWNRGWGRYESSDYVGGVDQYEPHNHPDGESHYVCIPFDQLFGGSSNGSGHYPVKGLAEFPGVTVIYPASYRREVSSAAALTEALGKGVSVILDTDIDFGSNQLAITGENQVVDLGGHTLTTNMTHGGIALKNGASIVNGTIEHTSTVAAIKAFNVGSIENVTITTTCATADKTVTGIAVQQGATVESIKNVTINGVSQGIEVGYQATVGLIENAIVNESNNGTKEGIGLVINGGKVGKAKDCTFKGETYGIKMLLKGVFDAGLELENCTVEGASASIYACDEKGISNTSGSLVLTYDATTTLTGPFVWDFEDECKSVVTLNSPQ